MHLLCFDRPLSNGISNDALVCVSCVAYTVESSSYSARPVVVFFCRILSRMACYYSEKSGCSKIKEANFLHQKKKISTALFTQNALEFVNC